jgi:hypothetical protein
MTTLVVPKANALPPLDGQMISNAQYGHECYDPNATQPKNEAMSTIMESMNCNSITDTVKFCECVKHVADLLELDNPLDQFKRTFIEDKVMSHSRNLTLGLNLKFRDSFLTAFKKTEGIENFDYCSVTKDKDLSEHPIAARIHKRMQQDLIQFNQVTNSREFQQQRQNATEQITAHMTDEEKTKFESERIQIHAGIQRNVSSINKASQVKKTDNREAAAFIVKFMATNKSASGNSYAKEFLNIKTNQSTEQNQDVLMFDLLGSTENSETAGTILQRARLFKIVMDKVKSSPEIKNSSLGLSNDQELMSDLFGVFNRMVTSSLKKLEGLDGINFDKPLDPNTLNDSDVMNRVNESFNLNINEAFEESCLSVVNEYEMFLRAFEKNGHSPEAFSYGEAERVYDDLFSSSPRYTPHDTSREDAEKAYRILEAKLAQSYSQHMEPQKASKLMVGLDLHYCTKPPTAPSYTGANLFHAMRKINDAGENVADGFFPPEISLGGDKSGIKDLIQRMEGAAKTSLELNSTYLKAVEHYNSSSLKTSQIKLELERQRNALEKINAEENSDMLLKNMTINRITDLEADLIKATKVEEAASDAVNTAYQNFQQQDRKSYHEFGPGYRALMDSQLGWLVDKQEDCFKRYIKTENGYVPNPNWHEEAAKCQQDIRNQIKEELAIDFNNTGDSGHTSYYSTDAGANLSRSYDRSDSRIAKAGIIKNASIDDLDKYGQGIKEDIRKFTGAIEPSVPSRKGEVNSSPSTDDSIQKLKNEISEASDKLLDKKMDPFASESEIVDANSASQLKEDLPKEQEGAVARDARTANTEGQESGATDSEINNKFDEISKTLGQLPGNAGATANNDTSNPETTRIQEEAQAIIQREEEIAKTKELAKEVVEVNQDQSSSAESTGMSPEYEKLLAEVQALRQKNNDLQTNVAQMTETRKTRQQQVQRAQNVIETTQEETVASVSNEAPTETYNFNENGRQPASVNESANYANAKANTVNNAKRGGIAPRVQTGGKGSQIDDSTPLPTPTSRGGELQNATIALNSTISNDSPALPILSGVDQSREVLTGDSGLNGYLRLVGSNNELSLDSFNEIRLNPEKFSQLNIDSSQPIIIKTPNGHMVMLAVVEEDVVKGFRYVKEIKPEHVSRRIASEEAELQERKERLIQEVDLEALLDSGTK